MATANTIRKFIAPEDQWPINDVWAYHDLHHTTQNFPAFMDAVKSHGEPVSMEDFSKKSQMVTYDAWRNMLEAWNSKMWNTTSGLVLWMSHPAWPSMIWQTYTYDYETPGSYFGAKKACEPLHVQKNLPNGDVIIVNTTRNNYSNVNVTETHYNINGKELYKKTGIYNANANQVTACFTPAATKGLHLVRLTMKMKGQTVSVNDYWQTDDASPKFSELESPTLKMTKKTQGGKLILSIRNTSKVVAVAVKLNAKNNATNEIILPAYFSDGYFNLLPNETRTIELSIPNAPNSYGIIAEGTNFKSVEL